MSKIKGERSRFAVNGQNERRANERRKASTRGPNESIVAAEDWKRVL
jgi:hypothetical protein